MGAIFNKRLKRGYISLVEEIIFYEIFVNPDSKKAILILPADPNFGGSMHDPIINELFTTFDKAGFSVMRITFAKYNSTNNNYDRYIAQASIAFEELKNELESNMEFWIVGYSLGAVISINLLLRRPEMTGFVAIAPPLNIYDSVSWITPSLVQGMIVYGTKDELTSVKSTESYCKFLKTTKKFKVTPLPIFGVGHLFSKKQTVVALEVLKYIRNTNASNLFTED